MAPKRQREVAMALVAAAIIAVSVYRVRTSTSPAPVAAAARPAAGAKPQAGHAEDRVADVDLKALEAERPEPVDSTRNPFKFKPKPPPPPPPAPPAPPRPLGPVQTGPVEPPPPPRIQLKFIGLMEKFAVLTDGKGPPILGKEGQVIEGRYRILRIGVESLELAYLDGRGRQTIRLTGQ